MKVLIDNGHGAETPGKRSPDGHLREYAYTREIAVRVADKLNAAGIDTQCIVPEDIDIPLAERVSRANKAYAEARRQAIPSTATPWAAERNGCPHVAGACL